MTDQTKSEALEASIKHWRENVKAETPDDVLTGCENCALCAEFYSLDCKGCPVYLRTGGIVCRGSPYDAAYVALRGEWIHVNPDDKPAWLAARDKFRKAAQADVDFLISLRETE